MSNVIDPEHENPHATSILEVLDLAESHARTTEDIFVGRSQLMPHRRVYGGQVLAQALVAAERTVADGRLPHSTHGYFLRPGDDTKTITFAVDRIHDGRSFSTRRTQAFQEGRPIFSMISSFQSDDPGLDHEMPMPDGIPSPDECGPDVSLSSGAPDQKFLLSDLIQVRHVEGPIHLRPAAERTARQHVWMRTSSAMPDDPRLHRAVLLYMSDLTIQEPTMRRHGVSWRHPGLRSASLDHAMWWHRPGRVDEWMLYVQESVSASGGRGLSHGRIYSRDRVLLASVSQETMVRVPED